MRASALPSLLLALAPLAGAPSSHAQAPAPAAPVASTTSPPDSLAAGVAALARVGAAFAPSLSPDGARVAFVTRLSGTPQVWVAPASSGYPRQVTAFDDPVTGVLWSPDGAWLAVGVAPGGGNNEQVYLVRPDGTGLRRITPGGKDNNQFNTWSRDGRTLFLASNRDRPEEMQVYAYDLTRGTTTRVTGTGGVGGAVDVTGDGARLTVFRLKSRGDSDVWLRDTRSGREVRLTPHADRSEFDGGLFSDARTVWLASNRDTDLRALARVRLGPDGAPGPLEVVAGRADADLDEVAVAEDGSVGALVWNVAGRSELELFDPASGRRTPVARVPTELVGAVTFSRDGRRLAWTGSGAAATADVYVLDRASGAITRVTYSPTPGVDLAAAVRPELVRFRAHDGLALTGWLYRPRGARDTPGAYVIDFHGGPEGQARPALNVTYQALLARGVGVFAPNVRGSSGFGKRFVNLDNGALRADGVRDIASCVDYLTTQRIADPKRVGIMGGSYGGYMVMAGLADYPTRFAAGANLFGVVNFATFFANTEPWMAAISTVEYGNPATEADLLRRLSPLNRVDRVTAPTLVLHGANDTNVPVVEAEQVVASLKRRGVPVEYVLFPDEGHGWRKTANRVRSTVEIVRWFERHLTPLATAGSGPSR
jgi:dipeptidyl aminopeptidase/acylaminoacyl peptidase